MTSDKWTWARVIAAGVALAATTGCSGQDGAGASSGDGTDDGDEIGEQESIGEALTLAAKRVLPSGQRLTSMPIQPANRNLTGGKVVAWQIFPYRWGTKERGLVVVGVDRTNKVLTSFTPTLMSTRAHYDTHWVDGVTGIKLTGAGGERGARKAGKFFAATGEAIVYYGVEAEARKSALSRLTADQNAGLASAYFGAAASAFGIVAKFFPQTAAASWIVQGATWSAEWLSGSFWAASAGAGALAILGPAWRDRAVGVNEVNGFYNWNGVNTSGLYPAVPYYVNADGDRIYFCLDPSQVPSRYFGCH